MPNPIESFKPPSSLLERLTGGRIPMAEQCVNLAYVSRDDIAISR